MTRVHLFNVVTNHPPWSMVFWEIQLLSDNRAVVKVISKLNPDRLIIKRHSGTNSDTG